MWKYIKKRWRGNLLAITILSVYVLLTFIETFILMQILDDLTNAQDWSILKYKIGIFAIILLLSTVCYFAGSIFRAKVHAAMRDDIRCELSKQIAAYSYQGFRKKNIADYIAWYSTNIEQISTLGFSSFFSICTTMFQTVIAVISLGIIYWKMSIYSIFLIGILFLISILTREYIIHRSKEKVESNEVFLQKINDLLQGFSVLYCYKQMHRYQEKMEVSSREYEKTNFANTVAQVEVNTLLLSANIIFQGMFLIIAVWCILHQMIKASAIIGIYSFLPKVFDGITDTVQLRNAIISTSPYFEIMELDVGNEIKNDVEVDINSIEIKNLGYAYSDKQIFSGINYRFEKGKKYAMLGKSGCGKSTLLKILAGLISDYQGTIEINGKKIDRKESILSQIAYIDQQPILFDGTISENICLWNRPEEHQIVSALENSGLKDVDKIFENGLETMIVEGGKNLSGGQKQRIAIARALYAKKTILFIDEGTSALDSMTREAVEKKLMNREDLTLIMISHHLNEEEKREMDGILYM